MGMKRETTPYTASRAYILATLEKNNGKLSISSLAKETGLSRASIYNHLKVLKERGWVIDKQELKELGQPIYLYLLPKANPQSLWAMKMFKQLFPEKFK